MDLSNIQDLFPLFLLFGGMGSSSDENPQSLTDMFPMIFMMKAMENPDGNYRTTIEDEMLKAMQYEMLIKSQSNTAFSNGLSLILTLATL